MAILHSFLNNRVRLAVIMIEIVNNPLAVWC